MSLGSSQVIITLDLKAFRAKEIFRSGRLKSKTLKDQEALQRRVAIAARTGHDKNVRFDGIVSLWRKIFK